MGDSTLTTDLGRVLVTGGSGFVGANLVAALLAHLTPGAVITERQRRLWISESDLKAIVERQCLHQVLLADEIARAALFLGSADSAMITKQCLIVDGGLR